MSPDTTYLLLACLFGFLMAWGVGANDVANAMGTSVGSKAVTIKQALIIATIFEFSGAILAGGQVTHTIRSGIIDPSTLIHQPTMLIFGMLASLLAAAFWLFVASYFGWPVSTSHTIIGAIVGFGAVNIGVDAVHWNQVGSIALSWLFSPMLGCLLAYALFRSVQVFILHTDDPFKNAKRIAPIYIFVSSWVIIMITLVRGLKHIGLHLTFIESCDVGIGISAIITLIAVFALNRLKFDPEADKDFLYTNVEKIFSILMIFTACTMAFAHGSNDVANAIGPLATIAGVVETGDVMNNMPIPSWVLLLGAVGIVTGLVTYGHKVITTVGKGITELTPSRGFAATLSAAFTVVLASGTGLPISTTHTLVGAVLGVGLARGIGALNLNVIRKIFMSWVITLPAGAFLAIGFYHLLWRVFATP